VPIFSIGFYLRNGWAESVEFARMQIVFGGKAAFIGSALHVTRSIWPTKIEAWIWISRRAKIVPPL
jgi:hypothetical protein